MLHPIADPPPVGVLADATIHQNFPVKREGDRLRHGVEVHPAKTYAQVVDIDDDPVRTIARGEVIITIAVPIDDDAHLLPIARMARFVTGPVSSGLKASSSMDK